MTVYMTVLGRYDGGACLARGARVSGSGWSEEEARESARRVLRRTFGPGLEVREGVDHSEEE